MNQVTKIVEQRIARMLPNGQPAFGAAQRLVADSAYWYDHPSGRPVHAPKDHDRVTLGPHGLELPLGENKFLVGLAMKQCAAILIAAFEVADKTGKSPPANELQRRMELALCKCFSGHNNWLYERGYPIRDGHFHCGSHSICAADFCNAIIQMLKLEKMVGQDYGSA